MLPPDSTTFTHLQLFLAVARLGSVAKASVALDVPKVTVLAALRHLERESQVPLFKTRGRICELTDEGLAIEELVTDVVTATGNLSAALGKQNPLQSGRVVVASALDETVLPLGEWFGGLTSRCPLLVIEIRALRHGASPPRRTDVLFTCEPFSPRGWTSRKLMQIEYGLYGSVAYFERRHKPEDVRDLAVHSLIAGPRSSGLATGDSDAGDAWATYLSRAPRLLTDSNGAALDAVAAGGGIGLLPVSLAERAKGHLLVRVLPDWRIPPDEVFMSYRNSSQALPRVAAVIANAIANAS